MLILDNCSIHHADEVRQLVEEEARKYLFLLLAVQLALTVILECRLIFLPPYSPDYNPIEQAFSCIKTWLHHHQFDRSLTALSQACQHITPKMSAGFFQSSGYI